MTKLTINQTGDNGEQAKILGKSTKGGRVRFKIGNLIKKVFYCRKCNYFPCNCAKSSQYPTGITPPTEPPDWHNKHP